MNFLRTLAGSIVVLLIVQPTFAQESAQPARPPQNSQPVNPQQSTETGSSSIKAIVQGNLEVLTDTQGVDFGPYLNRVLGAVRQNWYAIIPESARSPELKRGTVSIQFIILPNGKVAGMQYTGSSGDIALDRAAWGGITASDPFSPLPSDFHGPYLALRMHFQYNPSKADLPQQPAAPPASASPQR